MADKSYRKLEELRMLLRKGMVGSIHAELKIRCLLFDIEMNITRAKGKILMKKETDAALHAIRGAAQVFGEYGVVANDAALREAIGRLATFGIIQTITHVIEAADLLCTALGVPKGKMKEREYWEFRNNQTHIKRRKPNKNGFDIHELPPEATGFGQFRYASYGGPAGGYSVQGFSVDDSLRVLSFDLEEIFVRCLSKMDEVSASDLADREI